MFQDYVRMIERREGEAGVNENMDQVNEKAGVATY